jgi:large conductance mechanosensitive channel
MGFVKEFRDFAVRGNVVDMAVGVIIGGAFGKIVTSVVEDIIMPPVARVVGNIDFTNLYVPLSEKVVKAQMAYSSTNTLAHVLPLADARKIGPVFAYGNFATTTINFIILAFCIFLMVKAINHVRRKEEAKPSEPPAPTGQEKLLMEIRDLLKK